MADDYVSRSLERAVERVGEEFPVLLVTGPRQVGKTTMLRRIAGSGRRFVSLDDLALRELARADPALLLQRFPPPILIDEIQYAPELLPRIKLEVDEKRRPGAFWLTGSQRFELMRGITETLAGRVATLQMLGFSVREREGRTLDVPPFLPSPSALSERLRSSGETRLSLAFEYAWRGSFPALATGLVTDRDIFYESYLQTYIQRDVSDLAQVGDTSAFRRFVRACAARTAQILNLADLARDADISPSTAKRWLGILEASFQVHLLEPYHNNITKRLVKAPKLYFLDTGLASYLTGWSSPETLASGAMAGPVFETWVIGDVLRSWWHCGRKPQLSFYRDKDGREIDLIFDSDGALHPVEIKLGASPRRDWIRHFGGLARFGRPVAEGAVICLAPEAVPIGDGVNAIPVGAL